MKKFSILTWRDLEEWTGSRILNRGIRYHQQGRVSELSILGKDALLAYVHGSEKYVTKVIMNEDGLPESICSCPYEFDCKHGVAVVLEYLHRVEKNQSIPKAKKDDDRLEQLDEELLEDYPDDDESAIPQGVLQDVEGFIKGKTKAQLKELILGLVEQYPEMARDLSDRQQLMSGRAKSIVTGLRTDIQEMADEPGWQDYWGNRGFTPDYAPIRKKLATLIETGHADEVLDLGQELVAVGMQQVEASDDEGETAMEVARCMPIIVSALQKSSLDDIEKLNWALDALMEDQYEICEASAEYLHRSHSQSSWHELADRIIDRLEKSANTRASDDFRRHYERDRLSDWAIHALERSNREGEIIQLCKTEARETGSYDRLVERLIGESLYDDAERWIQEGISKTRDKWPGIAANLRGKLREIRTVKKDWPVVTAIHVEEFVRRPSRGSFADCRKAAKKIKAWARVRNYLLNFLETGDLPWMQKDWSLPETGLDRPEPQQSKEFPRIYDLIDIAIFEKKSDQVLRWYDQRPKDCFGLYGVGEDAIAIAVQVHAPDRAVDIWKALAERLIAQVKPKAYQEAAKYLRKAANVMDKRKKQAEWERYLLELREKHSRKRRLMEVLDTLNSQPILKVRK